MAGSKSPQERAVKHIPVCWGQSLSPSTILSFHSCNHDPPGLAYAIRGHVHSVILNVKTKNKMYVCMYVCMYFDSKQQQGHPVWVQDAQLGPLAEFASPSDTLKPGKCSSRKSCLLMFASVPPNLSTTESGYSKDSTFSTSSPSILM